MPMHLETDLTNAHERFAGFSYEQASQEAQRLIEEHKADWHSIVDDLVALRTIMRQQAPAS